MYEIRVEGHLPDHWTEWFEGLVIHNEPDDGASLIGPLPDQSALMSILTRLTTLNITLVSVTRNLQNKGVEKIQGDSSPGC